MSAVAEQTGAWLEQFTKQPPAPAWLQVLRDRAFAHFAELGFPTTHDEEWRFTNVAPIARTVFAPAAPDTLLAYPESVKELDPSQAEAHLARHAAFDRNPFVALNTAFLADVVVLEIPRGVIVEQPIEITYQVPPADVAQALEPAVSRLISTPVPGRGTVPKAGVGMSAAGRCGAGTIACATSTHPRTLIIVGEGAQCTIVETYQGTGTYFTNAVTEIVVGDRAVVDHYKVQQESPTAFHIATLQATLGRSAAFSSHNISLGGALVRNDVNATLSEGSDATLNGLYIVNGTQHIDNHTQIDHAMPHGTSHELYKGILDGKAHAVFNGKIIVRKDAQKTDSKQTNKNLVLSDDAVVDTKPELQIFADDVRCTHGATIGQLDAEALFYLQSRGIGKAQARSLLTYAFAQDVVDRIKVPSLRDSLEKILFEKFHERAD
jgi:Fe-S cluster assembly protein SufD